MKALFLVAYIITKHKLNINICYVSTENIGSANVIREVGKREGIPTLFIDIGKATLIV
ncbi:MAG: glycerol-3-phosphate acyltransferase [Dehalococcoidales bacterium]|nr:glycerol-3-phosphate acyltransferase [Dehalococcoidales bacterium]